MSEDVNSPRAPPRAQHDTSAALTPDPACRLGRRRAARCASAIPHAVVVGLAARAQGRLAGSLHCPASCCPMVARLCGSRAEPDRTATASQVTLLVSLYSGKSWFLRVCEILLTYKKKNLNKTTLTQEKECYKKLLRHGTGRKRKSRRPFEPSRPRRRALKHPCGLCAPRRSERGQRRRQTG